MSLLVFWFLLDLEPNLNWRRILKNLLCVEANSFRKLQRIRPKLFLNRLHCTMLLFCGEGHVVHQLHFFRALGKVDKIFFKKLSKKWIFSFYQIMSFNFKFTIWKIINPNPGILYNRKRSVSLIRLHKTDLDLFSAEQLSQILQIFVAVNPYFWYILSKA